MEVTLSPESYVSCIAVLEGELINIGASINPSPTPLIAPPVDR